MAPKLRLAVAGVGNNISALFQGVELYHEMLSKGIPESELPGIKNARIAGLGVADLEFVAAFDVNNVKVGMKFNDAILAEPNNYPRLDVAIREQGFVVELGLTSDDTDSSGSAFRRIVRVLRESNAEVLLYSLPTGLQWAATAYARAALEARVAFVNCTPELAARSPELLSEYERAGVPLIGDDLAGQLGASVVHRALLSLLNERGIALTSSYQLNLGGNEDFRNLRNQGGSKRRSKFNALAQDGIDTSNIEIIPSAGFLPQLKDNKVAILNIEGLGWAGTSVSLDAKLKVQDSSNAAGVIIDLIRIAGAAGRAGMGGFCPVAGLLKSPPDGHPSYPVAEVAATYRALADRPGADPGPPGPAVDQ
jgi:myo-inositol-1-phosphate synthase